MAEVSSADGSDGKHHGHHELGNKLKLPFRELKEKLHHNHHLSDVKVHLVHKK
jgi:phospholipase D1/2